MKILLNCDMGEGLGIWKMGLDEHIMPHINMANLACGFHASDANIMTKSVILAKQNNVTIGAHPGYDDLKGFGRRSIVHTSDEIKSLVLYQLGALDAISRANNTEVKYVKPHGALYNDMMKDEKIFDAIIDAICSFNKNIKLMILSTENNNYYINKASNKNIELIFEVFADRNYNDDGTLLSRTKENAVIHDVNEVIQRISVLKEEGFLKSISGKELNLKADTICVHGDNENALEFIQALKKVI